LCAGARRGDSFLATEVAVTIVPIRGLFEAHLTVSDLDRSIEFYRDVLGLPLATRIPERQVAFFWVPTPEKAMLGLWSIGTSPLRMRLHIAFQVELPQVFASVQALRAAGLTPLDSGGGTPIEEPCVLCWMPAASVYFDDPDGHSLEFICMLDEAPRPELGRVSWSEWRRQK
jgi:lactoylglutathione lyase